ncbi:dUTP diphosphatase [Clostridium senegalense]
MKIDFTELLKAQKELDQVIIGDKKIENLTEKKLVALSIELAELFNEIRCFKYWSNKGMSKKSVILEELVDVLHFWLSLMNDDDEINEKEKLELTSCCEMDINLTYLHMIDCIGSYKIEGYCDYLCEYMECLLMIAKDLNFTIAEIIEAYYRKRDINFKRQQEGY